MKRLFCKWGFVLTAIVLVACHNQGKDNVTLGKEQLLDKIKGGWAGQTIGCTYGGPTEFGYQEKMIPPSVTIPWSDGYIKDWFENRSWLYDDVYMDLTFVEVFERLGLDAPVDSLAMAFAKASYPLWHANQAARYNILHGIMPPHSGHWLNNPHSDDIDYQIEADFAGLMSPGMPNTASEISDKVGHIMTYGDGWYGGVYVGAMYSLAFVSDDIEFIVSEALKTIPEQSRYYKCMSDIIAWHKTYPDDWTKTWSECEQKYNADYWCPDGVYTSLNIDAVLNSAYILIGLLYGEGDFGKTIDISTRCGQDSDCNPSSAAGILGTMLGYGNIPDYWLKEVRLVEDMNFDYTDISLNRVYEMTLGQALQLIQRNGGRVDGDKITIKYQHPQPVRYEKGFDGISPVKRIRVDETLSETGTVVEFEGSGIALRGNVTSTDIEYEAEMEVIIDGVSSGNVLLPANSTVRRYDLYWNYQLSEGPHNITFKWLNRQPSATVRFTDAVIYGNS